MVSVFIHFIFVSFSTSTLPIPDTKGISSSLSILAKCLQQMTLTEYFPLAQMYGLSASHPLLQSYYCSYEAAFRSQYTPLFYARHKVSDLHKSNRPLWLVLIGTKERVYIRKEFYSQGFVWNTNMAVIMLGTPIRPPRPYVKTGVQFYYEVSREFAPLSFHKLVARMHKDKTKFEKKIVLKSIITWLHWKNKT